jgi:hypothetical protein
VRDSIDERDTAQLLLLVRDVNDQIYVVTLLLSAKVKIDTACEVLYERF